MRFIISRAAAVALVACVACAAACGSGDDLPPDGPSRPDAALPPDAPTVNDADHDGAPARNDCDDTNPKVWRNLPYSYRDADGDDRWIAASGTVCSGLDLPPGYASTPTGASDCDDTNPAVFTTLTGYVDADTDGVGDGTAQSLCTAGSLPAGYAATGTDCAPADSTRWLDLPYSFRDADGDGAAVAETGTVCSGAALPAGYLTSAPAGRPLDCDDADPAVFVGLTVYADFDHDGVGAGPAQLACTAGAPPAGYSTTGTDCADADASGWVPLPYTAVDFDGDGATAPAQGTRCTAGTLLPPYYATAVGDDCNDADAAVSISLAVFVDADGDGIGAGPALLRCTNGAPPPGYALTGTDCNDSDAARWTLVAYRGIDADADGVTVPATGQLCTNGTLPPPYTAAENGNDCDDSNPALTRYAVLYPDQDGDGVGAPPREIRCIGAAVPPGVTPGGYDDDDGDPAVIELDDEEQDLLLLGL